jgi:hypothetical protein
MLPVPALIIKFSLLVEPLIVESKVTLLFVVVRVTLELKTTESS